MYAAYKGQGQLCHGRSKVGHKVSHYCDKKHALHLSTTQSYSMHEVQICCLEPLLPKEYLEVLNLKGVTLFQLF